jgi:hypothetical protein
MLQDVDTLEDQMERFDYVFRGIIAVDKETRACLKSSRGRQKLGRKHKYFVTAPDGTFHTQWLQRSVSPENPKGEEQVEGYSVVFVFTAWNDDHAIERANELFPKKFAAYQAALEQAKQV